MNKKEQLIEKILTELEKYNIIEFLYQEIDNTLTYLNKYKLQNIYNNINDFIEDILKINQNYIDGLKRI